MRLSCPFFQLPVLFDVKRLQSEVQSLPDEAWAPHPDRIPGNSAVRLVTAGGYETDAVHGRMAATSWLKSMPYLQQVLAGFGVVWGRSRLMRLAPGVGVPEHADINYHWHTRVRLHIPVFTHPQVRFHCDRQSVHMGQGEAWIFDNWRRHRVENNSDIERIHLVADTTGTSAFWRFACGPSPAREQWRTVAWDPSADINLLTERDQRSTVMPAAEVQWLLEDLRTDLHVASDNSRVHANAARFAMLLDSFVLDWRQLCALHGNDGEGLADFQRLVKNFRESVTPLGNELIMRSNGVSASLVLEKRLLQHVFADLKS